MLTPDQIKQAEIAALEIDMLEYASAMDRLRQGDFDSPEFQTAWAKIEKLKNKRHGMPPCALEGATAAFIAKPTADELIAAFEARQAQEQEDCETANQDGTR